MTIVIRAWKTSTSYPMTHKSEFATFGDADLASVKRQALGLYGTDCAIHIYGETFDGEIFPFAMKEHGKIRFKNV